MKTTTLFVLHAEKRKKSSSAYKKIISEYNLTSATISFNKSNGNSRMTGNFIFGG